MQVLGNSVRQLSPPFVKEVAPLTNSQRPHGQKSFFVLENLTITVLQTEIMLLILESKNLGAKRIKFDDKRGDHEYFMKRLCEEYPLLTSQNGAKWSQIGGSHHKPLQKLLLGRES